MALRVYSPFAPSDAQERHTQRLARPSAGTLQCVVEDDLTSIFVG